MATRRAGGPEETETLHCPPLTGGSVPSHVAARRPCGGAPTTKKQSGASLPSLSSRCERPYGVAVILPVLVPLLRVAGGDRRGGGAPGPRRPRIGAHTAVTSVRRGAAGLPMNSRLITAAYACNTTRFCRMSGSDNFTSPAFGPVPAAVQPQQRRRGNSSLRRRASTFSANLAVERIHLGE